MADPSLACGRRSISLRHRDRARAIAWAKEQVQKAAGGISRSAEELRRVEYVFRLYLQNRTVRKCRTEQLADARKAAMWMKFLGPQLDVAKISLKHWQEFIDVRGSGTINAQGDRVEDERNRSAVRPGTAGSELGFLNAVLNFACKDRKKRITAQGHRTRRWVERYEYAAELLHPSG